MRKNIFYLTTIAIMMLFAACSNEPLFGDKDFSQGKERTISLTATMPDDNPITRVSVTQDEDMAVSLKWEEGDQLQLVFVQGDIKKKATVTVGNITSNGQKAHFDIAIPEEITAKFDLYGVYGGGGLSNDNPTIAILPTKAGETGTLESIEEKDHVMFYFASKDMDLSYSEPMVMFKNFGSLFSITLKNTATTSIEDLAEARLVGVGGDGKWAYNIGDGGGSYDLLTGEFQGTETAGNHISFKTAKSSVASDESITFWGWYPPLPDKVWPELALHLLKADGVAIAVSANTMPARTEATAPGMSYYFEAEWDGTKLGVGTSKGPHIFVKTTGTDANDGLTWATATTLSKALEIMEAGDEIHIAAGTYVPTKMLTGGDQEGDKTFEINKNVKLIGGYPADASDGAVASSANETILSGDEKFYHTVTVTAPVEAGEKIRLKNLTIKKGNAAEKGAGKITINSHDYLRDYGGGLSIGASVVEFTDCVISDNISRYHAGGIYVHSDANVKFIDSDIINNKTINPSSNCGGLWNAATTTLVGCNVSDNYTTGVSGGIYNYEATKQPVFLYMYNSTVARNKTGGAGGGGIYARESSYTRIVNSTFYKNESGTGGGLALYGTSGKESVADVINSTFYSNNSGGTGGGINTVANTTLNLHNTIVTGNTSTTGDFNFVGNSSKSYMILGDKVLDKDGAEVAGKTFDHTTMINEIEANGTCMITGSSPAATMGMDAILLQTLATTFTPAIDADIITKDQLGASRSDKFVIGAVIPESIDVPGAESIIYVKTTGVESNDGSSWATATTLSKALEIMEAGDQIQIAAGTHKPTNMITGGDKDGDKTFEIHKNVTLIGGYPANATDGAVSSKANVTILSGDKKSYHTVTVTAPVEDEKKVVIKNLTIKDGLAGPINEGNVEVNGVKFNRSFAGGLSIGKSVVDVIDCVISENATKQHVGGVYVHSGAIAKFIDSDIINNTALVSDVTNCGGILNAATTYLIGCNVLDNKSGGVCGGIYNFDKENGGAIGPKLYIYNTTVAGNKAGAGWSGGGGLYAREGSHTEVVNSTFYNNEAQHGGAIRVYTASGLNPSSADIISSTFYKNNGRGNGGGIETQPGTTVKLYNNIITGNTSPNGADALLAPSTTTSSYMVLGNKVFDKDGNEVADKTFDHTTMISDLAVNGTCMITGSSPAATMGMDANLLQTLATTFTPAIDNDIITNDQLGTSRVDKGSMGAVVTDGSEPTIPAGAGIKEGSDQILWAKKLQEDLGIDTLHVTGGIAVTKDYVVLNTRGLESIYLNRMTGEKVGTLNMSSIVVPYALTNFYNTADDDGNILVCNLAPQAGSFKIWKIKDVTSTPELYIEYDGGIPLGRKISIKGSIDKDAIITAPIYAEGKQFLRWQVKDGALVSTTPDKITINGIEGTNWAAHADIVYTDPSDKNSDYFAAFRILPSRLAWVNGTTNSVKAWGPEISESRVTNAVDYTVFNNNPYVVQNYVNSQIPSHESGNDDGIMLFDASPTSTIATPVWKSITSIYGGNDNGGRNTNGSGDVALKVSDDGLHMHLYFMVTNGQIACVQFDAKE